MADVELEIMDLATGEGVGKFLLTLCTPMTYEFDIGNYRFTATYLKTGEKKQEDRIIVEGVNAPLTFEFTVTHALRIESQPLSVPIMLNGASIGNTPVEAVVQEGAHEVTVPEEVEI